MQFTLDQKEGESFKQSIVDITAAHQAAKNAIDLYNTKCAELREILQESLTALDGKLEDAERVIETVHDRFQDMFHYASNEYLESDKGMDDQGWVDDMTPQGHQTEDIPYIVLDPDEILPNLEQVIKGIEHVFLCD